MVIFEKYLDNDKVKTRVSGLSRNSEKVKKAKISKSIQQKLKEKGDIEIDVVVVFKRPYYKEEVHLEVGEVDFDKEGEQKSLIINGNSVTEKRLVSLNEKRLRIINPKHAFYNRKWVKLQNKILHNKELKYSILDKSNKKFQKIIRIKKSVLIKLITKYNDDIVAIEEPLKASSDLPDAMISTKVDPSGFTGGDGIGVYMSEFGGSGCPSVNVLSDNYTNLFNTPTFVNHANIVGSIIRTVSQGAYIYCGAPTEVARPQHIMGGSGNPRIFVENHAWSYYIINSQGNRGFDDVYRAADRDFDNQVYDNDILVVKSAGNNAPTVATPGKGFNVLTVGNYDDANLTISNSSNGNNPETGNDKPEISAPGSNLFLNGQFIDSGTSWSTPHVAGFAADLLSDWLIGSKLRLRPYLTKALIIAGATTDISGDADKVGEGGVNYLTSLISANKMQWWEGGNNDFSTFDSMDYLPNNGRIDSKFYAYAKYPKTRVVISWLNRGDYTLANRTASHPIGTDLDLRVYDPQGNLIGTSMSWDNGYEVVEFNTPVNGYYRVSISRYANRDTLSKLSIGLAVMSSKSSWWTN